MERSTFFGRSAPLCQPSTSCSRPNGHTAADRLVVCVATPTRPPTAKVAKRLADASASHELHSDVVIPGLHLVRRCIPEQSRVRSSNSDEDLDNGYQSNATERFTVLSVAEPI